MTDAESAWERAEAITAIMASWALEGMHPTPAVTSAQDPATADHRRETLHRMRAHRHRQNPPRPPSPTEIILQAIVNGTSRDALVETLSAYPYVFSRMVGDGTDAVALGNWNQVAAAHLGGLLSDAEYRQITDAVQPPPYT